MVSDDDLLEAWRAGDKKAGDQLVSAHFAGIHRFWRRRVGDAADDMAQQTFEACLAGRDGYRGEGKFRAYLFGIAHNQLLMFLRKKQRTPEIESAEAELPSPQDSPSQLVGAKQRHKVLSRAMTTLPLDLQIAVELYYWEGFSTPEMATSLGVSESTVRGRLWRARELLAEQLRTMDINEAVRASTITHLAARLKLPAP